MLVSAQQVLYTLSQSHDSRSTDVMRAITRPIYSLEIAWPYYKIFFVTLTFVFTVDTENNFYVKQKNNSTKESGT